MMFEKLRAMPEPDRTVLVRELVAFAIVAAVTLAGLAVLAVTTWPS